MSFHEIRAGGLGWRGRRRPRVTGSRGGCLRGRWRSCWRLRRAEVTLRNVSYDPTREFYVDYNATFIKYWKAKTGQDVVINQSHGGSGGQARGGDRRVAGRCRDARARVLTSTRSRRRASCCRSTGRAAFRITAHPTPPRSSSSCARGIRRGFATGDDLVKPGISVITPNPKTSGGARWNYLAAWALGAEATGRYAATAKEFVRKLYKNVPVLDAGARGATTTFVQRGLGDVLIAWENEAFLAIKQLGERQAADRCADGERAGRAAGRGGGQGRAAEGDERGGDGVPAVPLQQGRAGDHCARITTGRAIRRSPRSMPTEFPKLNLVTIADFGGWAEGAAGALQRGWSVRSDLRAVMA